MHLGHTYMDEICRSIKRDEVVAAGPVLSDNTVAYAMSKSFKSAMVRMANIEGIQLNHEHLAAIAVLLCLDERIF